MELSGKLGIVTGASRGIGRALAKEFAKHGCRLLLTALEEDELASLSNELKIYPVRGSVMAADLSDPEGCRNFIRWVLGQNEIPAILVNNAGMGGNFGRFEDQALDNIEKTMALNTSALVHLTHELIPLLKKRPRRIVNRSAVAGSIRVLRLWATGFRISLSDPILRDRWHR
jgi:NAD(P)-dependent dehydrogenase (short-subunit alcohol dehydrogenase family)